MNKFTMTENSNRVGFFLSKTSKVILVHSIRTDHKGESLAHGQIKFNHFNIK
jgi:hypothetical protein